MSKGNSQISILSCRSQNDLKNVFRSRNYQISSEMCVSAGVVKGITAHYKKLMSFSTCLCTSNSIFISPNQLNTGVVGGGLQHEFYFIIIAACFCAKS